MFLKATHSGRRFVMCWLALVAGALIPEGSRPYQTVMWVSPTDRARIPSMAVITGSARQGRVELPGDKTKGEQ